MPAIMASLLLCNFGFHETETVSPKKKCNILKIFGVARVLSFYSKTIYGDLLLDFQIHTSVCFWINIMQGNMEPEISMAVRKQTKEQPQKQADRVDEKHRTIVKKLHLIIKCPIQSPGYKPD